MPKLTVELIPFSTSGDNCRSRLPKEEWDKLRNACYEKAEFDCEVCGGHGSKWRVECHEQWEYDLKTMTQSLVKLVALCPACHEAKHIGFASIRGYFKRAFKHLCKVNDWTTEKGDEYLKEVGLKFHGIRDLDWKIESKIKGVKL